MHLKRIRKEIDILDIELLKLLNSRMELALESKRFKEAIEDTGREAEILALIKKTARGLIKPGFCEKLFKEIICESKRLQEKDYRLIGFQGEHGAYSEVAARRAEPEGAFIPCETFAAVFEGVASGALDLGVVPVENYLGGTVAQVNELLVETDLHVTGEILLPVHHCLLALPETDYREIRVVYSHPQALAQCRAFIERHGFEARPFYDTAGAARMLFHERPEGTAVIAGELCGALYHLESVKADIEDCDTNVTRFLVLSREPNQAEADKCSIHFSAEHKAGALFEVLEMFAEKGINLTRIESMPRGLDPGNYVFFLDFEGSGREPEVQAVLEEVEERTTRFRNLGSYRKGRLSDQAS